MKTPRAVTQINLSDGIALYDPSTGEPVELRGSDGAAHVAEQANVSGLRNPSSETNSYMIAYDDWNLTVIDLSGDASTVVSAAPARIGGVYVNTVLSAHTVTIDDDVAPKFTLPASLAAGTFLPLKGRFETSLLVNPNDSSTGSITVLWRPI